MALKVGARFWIAGGVAACLAAACGEPTREFDSAAEAGDGGMPSAGKGSSSAIAGSTATGGSGAAAGTDSDLGGKAGETNDTPGGEPSGGAGRNAAGAGGSPDAVEVDHCHPNPCKNDGVCQNNAVGFRCECTPGHAGAACDEKLLEALPLLGNATACHAEDLSGNGRVAVGDCVVSGVSTAFWWKPSIGTKALPASGLSSARSITRDGTFVVGYQRPEGGETRGASWLNGAGSLGYPGLSYDGMAVSGTPTSVSDDGKVLAGGSETANDHPRAVRWVEHVPVVLGAGHDEIYATGMSGDGSVIVGYAYDPNAAVKWTPAGGLVNLPLPVGADGGAAWDVSRDGRVIVGNAGGEAQRWVAGAAPVSLGVQGIARAASEKGDVIVGSSGGEAMVWDQAHGARILSDLLFDLGADLTDWTLSEAIAVSDDGHVIAGNGTLAGVEQVWLARLP